MHGLHATSSHIIGTSAAQRPSDTLTGTMTNPRYVSSFTLGALLQRESQTIAALYLEHGDWVLARRACIADNLLRKRTASTTAKLTAEVISRLKHLTHPQLEVLAHGAHQDQCLLLWLAICKHYALIRDFAIEVLHEKFLRYDLILGLTDYDRFFNDKAEWHPELERLGLPSRLKAREVIFRMLRQAGLLREEGSIIPALISPPLARLLTDGCPQAAAFFPAAEQDLNTEDR